MRTLLFLFSLAGSLAAQDLPQPEYYTAPFGKGGTWNLYALVKEPVPWTEAHRVASATIDPLGKTNQAGHLVCIGSIEENMFARSLITHFKRLWIGLTDNERIKGAKESNGATDEGWRWVTGESPGVVNWQPNEPDDGDGTIPDGEDFAALKRYGFWAAYPAATSYGYLVEWETNAPGPIGGAVPFTPIMPKGTVLPLAGGAANWQGILFPMGGATDHRTVAGTAAGTPVSFDALNHYYIAPHRVGGEGKHHRTGWIGAGEPLPPPAHFGKFGGRFVSTVQLSQRATYTIALLADDRVACRVGDHKFVSSSGWGGIDPIDPTVLYQEHNHNNGWVLGVIELSAGKHRFEVNFSTEGYEAYLQVLAAPGAHTHLGSTDGWRIPGHKAVLQQLPWPGINAEGWKVECTTPRKLAAGSKGDTLQDALLRLGVGKFQSLKGVKHLCYHDPDSSNTTHFPNPEPFPNNAKGNDDGFALRASATLEIPADGAYHLGFNSDQTGALRVKGVEWTGVVRDSSGRVAIQGDTMYCDNGSLFHKFGADVLGEIELKKGTYPIEFFYAESRGPARVEVFGAPAKYPPRLLKAGGGELMKDHDGLPLAPPK